MGRGRFSSWAAEFCLDKLFWRRLCPGGSGKKRFLALQVLKAVPSLSSGMLSPLLEEGESEEPPNKQLERACCLESGSFLYSPFLVARRRW